MEQSTIKLIFFNALIYFTSSDLLLRLQSPLGIWLWGTIVEDNWIINAKWDGRNEYQYVFRFEDSEEECDDRKPVINDRGMVGENTSSRVNHSHGTVSLRLPVETNINNTGIVVS